MKEFIITVIVSLCIGAGCTLALKSCGKKEVHDIVQIAKHEDDTAKKYRDLYGSEHAQRLLEVGNRETAEVFHRKYIDSLCKRLRLRERQLTDMAQVIARDSGRIIAPVTPIVIHDTVNGKPVERGALYFQWQDDYTRIAGLVDSVAANLTYGMTLPIHTTTYWKRRWFLGKKHWYIDAYSDNKQVNIEGLQGVKIN